MKLLLLASIVLLVSSCSSAKKAEMPTDSMAKIINAGVLRCGVSTGLKGFSYQENGIWKGFDVDICKAVSLALFGDANKVIYVPLTAQERFDALKSGKIDLLSRNTSQTLTRDTELALDFGPIVYYDGQTFLSDKNKDYNHSYSLRGKSICTQSGTSNESNIIHFNKDNNLHYNIKTYGNLASLADALAEGTCDALTADKSALLAIRSSMKNGDKYEVSDEIISKEALAPVVVEGSRDLLELVKWTVYALINAEELGITSQNVDQMKEHGSSEVKNLLNGLTVKPWSKKDWVNDVIKSVGNYGEIFDRNIGKLGTLEATRGWNSLWNQGGLLYAPSMK